MTTILMVTIGLSMFVTSFLSGVFGMAGGMILIGILLAILPLFILGAIALTRVRTTP